MFDDYPVRVRIPRPERSSRLWAVLTITLIKYIALIPHFFVLGILAIGVAVVFWIGQVAVIFTGRYPRGLHAFMTGFLRWEARVQAFAINLTDVYPPFSLDKDSSYPVDFDVEYPEQSNRLLAAATVIIGVLSMALIVSNLRSGHSASNNPFSSNQPFNLRSLILLPHYIVLILLGIAAFFAFLIVPWIILIAATFPPGLHGFLSGVMRWSLRVSAWSRGLTDKYPPFDFGSTDEDLLTPAPPAWPYGGPPTGAGFGPPPYGPPAGPPPLGPPAFGPPAGPPPGPPAGLPPTPPADPSSGSPAPQSARRPAVSPTPPAEAAGEGSGWASQLEPEKPE